MTTNPSLYKLFSRFLAISILVSAFPVVSGWAVSDQTPTAARAVQPTMTVVSPPEGAVAVTVSSCLTISRDSEPRLDYLLNSNCGEVVIRALPAWPKVSVVETAINSSLAVIALPPAPAVRFAQIDQQPDLTIEAIFSSSTVPELHSVRAARFTSANQNLLPGQLRQSKTLSELQVQRC